MWQRIQTLYLAISIGLIAAMFFCLKAVIVSEGGELVELRYLSYIPYAILLVIILLLDILAIGCYKFRIFQMRTAILSALLTLALQAWIAVDYFTADPSVVFRVSAIFPFASMVMDCLAAKGIYADHLMVESFSSLRSRKRK